jgi:hypothetical protein
MPSHAPLRPRFLPNGQQETRGAAMSRFGGTLRA